jgi:hypothetical protein
MSPAHPWLQVVQHLPRKIIAGAASGGAELVVSSR